MKEFIEKLIERFEEEYLQAEKDMELSDTCDEASRCGGRAAAYEKAQKIVNQLAEEYNNGWIPVSSGRLPEIDGNTSDVVLVCTVDGFQHMAFWCDDKKWRYCESGMIKNTMEWTEILAWQPLPAVYKPKEE